MNKKYYLVVFILICSVSSVVQTQPSGEKLFSQVCNACHTIGEGKRVGPDLANVNSRRSESWLLKFIKSSQTLIKEGDSTAVAVFNENNKVEMPDQPLGDLEIKAILDYIALNSPDPNNPNVKTPKQIFDASSVTDLYVERGKELFEGTQKFANGAAPCIICHNVQLPGTFSGGIVAKDLSVAFTRLGAAGVDAIIRNPPYPAMINNFGDKPLTDEEVKYLLSYLYYADNWNLSKNYESNNEAYFVIIIIVLFNIVLSIMFFFWQRVKKISVNSFP